MDKNLTLGYSTCPNDTFVFYALAHNRIDSSGLSFKVELADVESLNLYAKKSLFDISKLSFAAIGHLLDKYGLLKSGAALGRGCGPLVVARPGYSLSRIKFAKVAVPGMWTTACMLLGIYMSGNLKAVPMPFDKIMPAVKRGDCDFGVIIHEGRFTYHEYGLVSLIDLGQWWESKTSLPVPLGGIGIRRDIKPDTVKKVETAIRESIKYAFSNQTEAGSYIEKHAQEMTPSVIRSHINLYVNDFTIDIGQEGEKAVDTLFAMARKQGILPESSMPLFAC